MCTKKTEEKKNQEWWESIASEGILKIHLSPHLLSQLTKEGFCIWVLNLINLPLWNVVLSLLQENYSLIPVEWKIPSFRHQRIEGPLNSKAGQEKAFTFIILGVWLVRKQGSTDESVTVGWEWRDPQFVGNLISDIWMHVSIWGLVVFQRILVNWQGIKIAFCLIKLIWVLLFTELLNMQLSNYYRYLKIFHVYFYSEGKQQLLYADHC